MKAALRIATKAVLRHMTAGVGWAVRRREDPAPRVLCYHGVCDEPPDEWSVTPGQLRAHMGILRRDHHPVSLPEIVAWLEGRGALPDRAVAVTFDDGYADVLLRAAPILAEAGVPGAAFVAPGLLRDGGMAADPSYEATRPMMDWGQVRALAQAGWTIGSHSLTHPVLAAQPEEEALRQLRDSRQELEERLGVEVSLLAYPYGTRRTVSPRDHRLAAQAGYRAAFMDMSGGLHPDSDRMALPRNKVLSCDSRKVVRASLSGRLDLWRLVEGRR